MSEFASTPRRRFLQWLGGTSLLGAVSVPSPLAAMPTPPADDADAVPPHPPAVAETWDMSWVARLTGQVKAVFDSPEHAGGAALYRAVSWWDQYREIYGLEKPQVSSVLVLRHFGFYFALGSEYWTRYEVGKQLRLRDQRGKKWAKVNPVSVTDPAATPQQRKFSLEQYMADGGVVLVCGWSFGRAVATIAKEERMSQEAARTRARELLVPGVILQPNGIFAALRAQEAGCRYINAS